MLKDQIDRDIKAALLGNDREKANVLRGLKSAILYAEVSENKREKGLDDNSILEDLNKESKKRKESSDLYLIGGNTERAKAELDEKSIIDKYLPKQLTDEEIDKIINEIIEKLEDINMKDMGKIIGMVKTKVGPAGDGSKIALLVKNKLSISQ